MNKKLLVLASILVALAAALSITVHVLATSAERQKQAEAQRLKDVGRKLMDAAQKRAKRLAMDAEEAEKRNPAPLGDFPRPPRKSEDLRP